jgi:hypothetical protein
MIKNQEFFDGSLPAGFDGIFVWDLIKKHALPKFGGVDLMDIDAILEKNTRFLLFETKVKGSKIPNGQKYTLKALHSLGCFTIIVIKFSIDEKDLRYISGIWVMMPDDKDYQRIDSIKSTNEDRLNLLLNLVRNWYRDAENKGALSIRKDKLTLWLKLKTKITGQYQRLQKFLQSLTKKVK